MPSLPGLAGLDTPFLPQAIAWGYLLSSLPGLADLDTPVSPQAEAWGNNLSSLPGRGFLDSTFFPIFNIDGSLSGHVNQVSKRRPTIAPQFTVGFMWQIQIGTEGEGVSERDTEMERKNMIFHIESKWSAEFHTTISPSLSLFSLIAIPGTYKYRLWQKSSKSSRILYHVWGLK